MNKTMEALLSAMPDEPNLQCGNIQFDEIQLLTNRDDCRVIYKLRGKEVAWQKLDNFWPGDNLTIKAISGQIEFSATNQ